MSEQNELLDKNIKSNQIQEFEELLKRYLALPECDKSYVLGFINGRTKENKISA